MSSPPDHHRSDAIEQLLAALREQLAHTGAMATETVAIPGTRVAITVSRPSDTDLLLDQIADDPEQNLPYWAEIWPSGIALGGDIVRHPERVRDRRVLELGSGVGITAAIAVEHGAHLTAIDYARESLLLTRMTTLRHTGREPDAVRQVNWRGAGFDALAADGPFDVVLGADLLYERRDIEPLLAALDTLLSPEGALWLAEPGREPAAIFLRELEVRGWTAESTAWEGPWPDPNDAGTVVRTHWLRRAPGTILDISGETVQKHLSES